MHRDVTKDLESVPDDAYFEKLRETFIADTKLKRSFGKLSRTNSAGFGANRRRVGEKGKSDKGKGKGGKGKSRGRRMWGPRKKGSKRSQSRTLGYSSNTGGRKIYPSNVPFKREHLNDHCRKCNHRTAAGEPVAPHRFGDLVCPEVQAGRVLCHPRWEKFASQYPQVKFYKRKTDGFGRDKGKGRGKGGTGFNGGKESSKDHRDSSFTPGFVEKFKKASSDRKSFPVNVVTRIEQEKYCFIDAGSEDQIGLSRSDAREVFVAELQQADQKMQEQNALMEQLRQVRLDHVGDRREPEFQWTVTPTEPT